MRRVCIFCVGTRWSISCSRCVAVCCSVLQCVAVCYSVVHVGLCLVRTVLQCVAVCCSVLQCVAAYHGMFACL